MNKKRAKLLWLLSATSMTHEPFSSDLGDREKASSTSCLIRCRRASIDGSGLAVSIVSPYRFQHLFFFLSLNRTGHCRIGLDSPGIDASRSDPSLFHSTCCTHCRSFSIDILLYNHVYSKSPFLASY